MFVATRRRWLSTCTRSSVRRSGFSSPYKNAYKIQLASFPGSPIVASSIAPRPRPLPLPLPLPILLPLRTPPPLLPLHHRRRFSTPITSQPQHPPANMSSCPKIDLSPLVKDDSSLEARIAEILQPVLDDPASVTPEALASDLDKLYPADYQPKEGDDADVVADILWTLWGFLLKVVKKIPADDERQQLLADALTELQGKQRQDAKVWGQDCKMWGDLGLLGPNMREAWDMRPNFDKADAAAVAEWASLNSFAARLLGSSVQNWNNFAIWELRGALEEDPRSSANRDGQLWACSEWILHADNVLRSGKGSADLDDMEKRMLKGGTKFSGEPGLSSERWAFWRDRFTELSGQVEDDTLKAKLGKVVEKM